MKFEKEEVVVASTAHISSLDSDILADEKVPISVYDYEYGYIVYLAEEETEKSLTNHGFTPEFTKLFLEARASGAHSLKLDCDGPTYDELRQFDW